MIEPVDDGSGPAARTRSSTRGRAEELRAPWDGGKSLDALVFATVWATGPDPRHDGIFRLQALRRGADGGWERFDRFCDPFGSVGTDDDEARQVASSRMVREFGVSGRQLEEAESAAVVFHDWFEFLAGRPLIVPERRTLEPWLAHFEVEPPPTYSDLTALAGVLAPGPLANEGERLAARLLGPSSPLAQRPLALEPDQLAVALAVLVAQSFARDETTLGVFAFGMREAWSRLKKSEPEVAREIALATKLCEHPTRWKPETDELYESFDLQGHLSDGRLSDALRAFASLEDAFDASTPAWVRRADNKRPPLPSYCEEDEVTLTGDDRRLIDEIFQEHLPRRFAPTSGEGQGEPSYRPAQHAVAASLAERFGHKELSLIHAPTGTGKTLAYLVPALLWAQRNGVRVGVATYTRALQEQAMDRDVPLAVELLRRAGVTGELRVAQLKGRQNYLCWRALRLQLPPAAKPGQEPKGGEDVLAWTLLALFGLGDADGDLDRFPRRAPFAAASLPGARSFARSWNGAVRRLLGVVRAEGGCCSHASDRKTCAAIAARRRAERAHVVVTNHAFALSRREFFRHLIFDECEHLHDVAHNAFSHAVSLRSLRDLLSRLYKPEGVSRRPLNRIVSVAIRDSAVWAAAHECIEARESSLFTLDEVEDASQGFKLWRAEAEDFRDTSDVHSLFREYVQEEEAEDLLLAHRRLYGSMNELSASLAQMSEHLDSLPVRGGIGRIRRTLDVLRTELDERLGDILAWIPRADDGRPDLRPETFYDLETNVAGDDVLAARVLLPHEYLGRHYYPDLKGAAFLSATTWLQGGFEAAGAYLGLQRAAAPTPSEEREPSHVHTFRAPETFDYGRVLVAAPRDVPSVRESKRAFLAYVARFLAYLAERTRGRTLALFTNADDVERTGRELEPFFSARHLPLYYQGMRGSSKEELGELFRGRNDATLLGVDTFWYGADFPGPTLEYLVIVRLPYGVPDRYHHAQCAALGAREQRRQVYMPRALAKFRQGFGRLMRKESDRGCVFLLDTRVNEPRHRSFLKELPIQRPFEAKPSSASEPADEERLARYVTGETDRCLREAFTHMGLGADLERRGLVADFHGWRPKSQEEPRSEAPRPSDSITGLEGELPF